MKKLFAVIGLLFSATGFAQNVGIGETNPTAGKLQVKAADSAVLLIQNTASALNTKTALFYKSDNNYSGGIATIQTAPSFYRMGLFTFGGAAASGLKERMSILDDGNVGIGTTTPNYLLDINGRARLRHNGNTSGIWYNKADNTDGSFVGMNNDTTFGFYGNNGWSSVIDIKNSRLGIGTLTPTAPLSFPGTLGNKIALWGNAAGGHYGLGIQGNLLQIYSQGTADDIVLGYGNSTAFTENMRVKGNGNVGIGTNNPGAKLEVAGSLKITDGTQGAGKVLTSNASGNASWANAAYGNTERFQFKFRSVSTLSSPVLTTKYNFGTATANSPFADRVIVNINKSGLYHFDLHIDQSSGSDYSVTSATPNMLEIQYGVNVIELINGRAPFIKYNNVSNSAASFDKSYEMYITAPASFYVDCYKVPNCNVYDLTITGHLIAE
jgi:hypothetical protein